jgi:preprotein translocase subunit SecA
MEELTHRPDEERPERVVVDFTDGQRGLRAVAGVEDAIASKGQEINDAMERVALLSFIDEHWTDHLRELDEVREGIGLRSFGRKDPLLEYKMEAYEMFTELVKTIDREVVSFVFRAGPLVEQQEDAESFRQRSRMDRSRAQTEHEDAQQQLGAGAEDIGPGEEGTEARQRASGAQRDPSSGGGQPVVVEDEPGRNDRVTIQNTSTGETATLKYKYAQKKLKKGWSLISVEE